MKNNKGTGIKSRAKSIGYALEGIKHLFVNEPNARIHFAATVIVIVAGAVQQLSKMEWLAIVFAIGIVWIAEIINTAIEKLCDHTHGKVYHSNIKIIKDLAAGGVLLAAICSLVIGIIVFIK